MPRGIYKRKSEVDRQQEITLAKVKFNKHVMEAIEEIDVHLRDFKMGHTGILLFGVQVKAVEESLTEEEWDMVQAKLEQLPPWVWMPV